MMHQNNNGFNPEHIQALNERLKLSNKRYLEKNTEDNSDEFVNFNFIGMYEGKEVIYDAAIYTLRLHHSSEVYEIAEHRAAQRFPEFKKIKYQEDENGDLKALDALEEEIGLFMAEVMMELEEEESVKVAEHIEWDPNIDYGIGLDIGLNVDKITPKVIEKFIKEFNEETLKLDKTLYSFQTEDDDEGFEPNNTQGSKSVSF